MYIITFRVIIFPSNKNTFIVSLFWLFITFLVIMIISAFQLPRFYFMYYHSLSSITIWDFGNKRKPHRARSIEYRGVLVWWYYRAETLESSLMNARDHFHDIPIIYKHRINLLANNSYDHSIAWGLLYTRDHYLLVLR